MSYSHSAGCDEASQLQMYWGKVGEECDGCIAGLAVVLRDRGHFSTTVFKGL